MCGQSHTAPTLTLGKMPRVPTEKEAV